MLPPAYPIVLLQGKQNMGTEKVLVAGSDVTASQLKDLFRQIEDGSVGRCHLQAFLDHQNPWRHDWLRVYRELGMEAEFTAAAASLSCEDKPGFWSVPVLKGVTPNKVVAIFRRLGVTAYVYIDDLDKAVTTNDRDPGNGSYVIRVASNVEADPELADKSANDLAKQGIKGATLLERLLLELAYFLATGDHLDKGSATLCSGSRGSGGFVPSVGWDADARGLYVYWCSPESRCGDLRARAVS